MSKQQVTVYTPESSLKSPAGMLRQMFRDLADSWDLAYTLTKRDISAQYRQSLLGYFWAFFTPLFNTGLWLFLQSSGIIRIADTGMPYPVYVLSGTLLWQIFTESLMTPQGQVNGFKAMLAKLNFPREAILLNGILRTLSTSGIKLLILLPVMFYFGMIPDWRILLFPLAVLSLVLVGTAIGLLLVPIGTLYTDVGRIIGPGLQLMMYVSPVVFAMPKEGLVTRIFELNFATPLLLTARAWLTGTDNSTWFLYFLGVNAVAIVLLFIGWIMFRVTMPVLVERMSS